MFQRETLSIGQSLRYREIQLEVARARKRGFQYKCFVMYSPGGGKGFMSDESTDLIYNGILVI